MGNRSAGSGAIQPAQCTGSSVITDTLLQSIHRMATRLNRPISWHDVCQGNADTAQLGEDRTKACFHTLEMLGAGSVSSDGTGTLHFCALGQFR